MSRFLRFAISGASSCAIDLALFQLFCVLLKNLFADVSYVFISGILARVISAVYNYTVNYYLVFRGKRGHRQSATRYFALAVAQGFCSATLTAALFRIIQCELELFVKLPVDIVLFFVSYVVQKKFVY